MKKIIILFVVILYLESCSNESDNQKLFYYPNGNIEYKIIYKGERADTCNFDEYKYSENGTIISKQSFINCKRDGKLLYYKGNNLWLSKPYKNDSVNGIVKLYSTYYPYSLIKELFVLNGNNIAARETTCKTDSMIFSMNNYYLHNQDSGLVNGYLTWNTNDYNQSLSHYYYINSQDSITDKDNFIATIKFIDDNNWNVRLELGEMDEKLDFIDDPQIYEGLNQLDISIVTYMKGDNLLMGRLYISPDSIGFSEDSIYEEFVFYHEFYVKEKDSWWQFW